MGGRVPGSNACDSTEIYQEGLRIPPLKLYERGVLNETLSTLIKINVRVPDRVWGDLRRPVRRLRRSASAASTSCFDALRRRRGRGLHDRAARLCRAADPQPRSRAGRKGTYAFTDHIDSDGFSDTPIPIKVAITVRDDGQLAGRLRRARSPQVKGALNSTPQLHAVARPISACAACSTKDVPNNVGVFRCIDGQGAGGLGAQSA